MIEKYAFIFSSIERINLPIHVTKNGEDTFFFPNKSGYTYNDSNQI